MKNILFIVLAISLAGGLSAHAGPYHGFRHHPYYGAQSPIPSGNIFGPNRSGVAPSTAIQQGRSVYVQPARTGSRTGGVND